MVSYFITSILPLSMMKTILLSLLFCFVVLSISSCAPAAPAASYNISAYDGYGNYVNDVVRVTNEKRIPMPDGHTVDVSSLVTYNSWVKKFPHIAFEGYHYLLWSNNSWTRVTAAEAQRHASRLRAVGYSAPAVTYTSTSYETDSNVGADSSSDSSVEKCTRCRGTGKTRTFMAHEWYEENCATCGGDGRVDYKPTFPTYFLFRR